MEIEPYGSGIVFAMVRLLESARSDVGGNRYRKLPVAYSSFGRQAAGASQRNFEYPFIDPLQARETRGGEAAEALQARQVRRQFVFAQPSLRSAAVLSG